jgi:mono/diheme cytochrome c family protein
MDPIEAMRDRRKGNTVRKLVLLGILAALNPALAFAAGAEKAPDAGDVSAGRDLALSLCTPCHVVSRDQEMPPILRPPAPSFRVIAGKQGISAESLRTFLSTTHSTIDTPGNMPNPSLSEDQIRVLVSYILSLRSSR